MTEFQAKKKDEQYFCNVFF